MRTNLVEADLKELSEQQMTLGSAKWADPNQIAERHRYEPGKIWLGRNPVNPDEAIGIEPETHVFICADTGGGKGRAFLVNNQVLWPGSLVTFGPKGDEPNMIAARRGQGDDDCDGLGQEVFILDPLGISDAPSEYLAYFDFLAGLDPADPNLVQKCQKRAYSFCDITAKGDSKDWQELGRDWVAIVMAHVLTEPGLDDAERTIVKVRDYIIEGARNRTEAIYKRRLEREEARAEAAGEDFDPRKISKENPYKVLLNAMAVNEACGGDISRAANSQLITLENSSRQFEGTRGNAARFFNWMTGPMVKAVSKQPDGPQRSFSPQDLKNKFITVFICLPEDSYGTLKAWLKGLMGSLLYGMAETQGLGKNGKRVLFSIDEFGNLGRIDLILEQFNSIRSAGVTLMLATQGVESLQDHYGDVWKRFPSAASLEIYFQAEEGALAEYIEKKLGILEVTKYGRGINVGSSDTHTNTHTVTDATSENDAYGKSVGIGQARSSGVANNRQKTRGSSVGTGENWNDSYSTNVNIGETHQVNKSYAFSGPAWFFHRWASGWKSRMTKGEGESTSLQRGQQKGSGTGGNINRSTQESDAIGVTENSSHTDSFNIAESRNRSTGKSHSEAHAKSVAETNSQSASIQESFHTRPLMRSSEITQYLKSPEDPRHDAYPGLAIVFDRSEDDPFVVRKSYHDQDPFFIRKFTPNKQFKFIPYEEQQLLGWQITPTHYHEISSVNLSEFAKIEQHFSFGNKLSEGDALITVTPSFPEDPVTEASIQEEYEARHGEKLEIRKSELKERVLRVPAGSQGGEIIRQNAKISQSVILLNKSFNPIDFEKQQEELFSGIDEDYKARLSEYGDKLGSFKNLLHKEAKAAEEEKARLAAEAELKARRFPKIGFFKHWGLNIGAWSLILGGAVFVLGMAYVVLAAIWGFLFEHPFLLAVFLWIVFCTWKKY